MPRSGQNGDAVFELFGVSRFRDLLQAPEQNRQHLAQDQNQPAHRILACRTLLFDALEAGFAVRRGGGRVRDQPGFTLLSAQQALLALTQTFFSRPLFDLFASRTVAWLAHSSVVPLS